jgi:penicillin-binding protein 1A
MTVRTAFAYSKNTVAAALGNEIGTGTIANMARRFGITTQINTSPSMVLGTSETRVIDMTRAFAQVAAKGKSLAPYGISKVTTIDGDILYQAKPAKSIQLVPDYVAGGMIDLMQSAVQLGSGKRAQIGRPVAGKTGTTSSNKDGWFIGFSSGITTGVWMGRDDAKPISSLQGGRAPAEAFAAFMKIATAKRPVENFATDVTFPERLFGEEEGDQAPEDAPILVDENGMPIEGEPQTGPVTAPDSTEPPVIDQEWIDRAMGKPQIGGKPQTGGTAPTADPIKFSPGNGT